jgi:hypothetical protein
MLRCRVNYKAITEVLDFLVRDCCAGVADHRTGAD